MIKIGISLIFYGIIALSVYTAYLMIKDLRKLERIRKLNRMYYEQKDLRN